MCDRTRLAKEHGAGVRVQTEQSIHRAMLSQVTGQQVLPINPDQTSKAFGRRKVLVF